MTTLKADRPDTGMTPLVVAAPLLAYAVVTILFWIIPGMWIMVFSEEWLNPSAEGHRYTALAVSLLPAGSTSVSSLGVMLLALAAPLVFLIPVWWICRVPQLRRVVEVGSRRDHIVLILVCAALTVFALVAFWTSIESLWNSQRDLGYAAQLNRRTAVSGMSPRVIFLLNGALPWCLVAAAAMIATRRIWWTAATIGISAVLLLLALASGFKIPFFVGALGMAIAIAVTYPNRRLVHAGVLAVVLIALTMMATGLGDILGVLNWIAFRTGDSLAFIAAEAATDQPVGFDVLRMLAGYSTQASPHWNTVVFDAMYPLRLHAEAHGATSIPLVLGAWLDGGEVVGFGMAFILGFALMMIGIASTLPGNAASRASILSVGIVAGVWASQVQAHALLWQSYSILGLAFLAAIVVGGVWILNGGRPRLTRSKPQLAAASIACVVLFGLAVLVVYARERSKLVTTTWPERPHLLAWLYGDGLQPKMQTTYGLPAVKHGPQLLSIEVLSSQGGIQFAWDLQPEDDYEVLLQGRWNTAEKLGIRIDRRDAAGVVTSEIIHISDELSWQHHFYCHNDDYLFLYVFLNGPGTLSLSTVHVRVVPR